MVAPASLTVGRTVKGTIFYKMTGSGNDFVVLDGRSTTADEWSHERIVRVCDRRNGVGAANTRLQGMDLNGWDTPMWRLPHVAEPDLLVFDLDPGAPATIVECCAVAQLLRPLLAEEGLEAFAKTSGGKGLQLLAPLSGVSSDEASATARALAERLERELPRFVVSRMTKSLRPGKVLIDWSQNNAHKTTIAPYSLRARSRPTVSTPVTWDEVARCTRPEDLVFTSGEVLDRVAEHGDLLAPLTANP